MAFLMKISLGLFCLCPYLWAFPRILGLLSFLVGFSIAGGGQSSQRSNIFAGLRWPTVVLKGKVFWLILFNTEDKRRNGDSQDIIFVLLSGLILKTWVYCHLCPKSGLISENSPLLLPLSRKWA